MEKQYIELYKENKSLINQFSAPVINKSRDEAFDLFEEIGFPTTKQEHYKYTDLKNVLSLKYVLDFKRTYNYMDPYKTFQCDVPEIRSFLYFVVNESFYSKTNSINGDLPKEVIICGLKEASEKYPELVEKHYGKLASKQKDGIIAFNGVFAQDGFFMYVPKGVQLDRPVQLVNIMSSDVDYMANAHNLIIIEEGAKAQLLVCDHTYDSVQFISNRLTEVFVGKNAMYEQYKLENTHIRTTNLNTLLVDQQESSVALINNITLHNGITRSNIEIALNGEHCETELCGMVIGDKKQHVDNFTNIYHNKPNCHSTELFKYVLDDMSVGAFTGRLYVAKDAQKTQAYQTNKNLLLTKGAKMRTKPQLEIYADDVKCSHGATVGQLDEKALFYMCTRGIPFKEARLLLMSAFTSDVIDHIRIPLLAERMRILVEKRLRGELSKCEGCMICQ
ncbi:MAG: Fe-S cluster assembly protein SufD [Bacteroidales bacterium 36-12]|nr:MAG: Fe-S cluster assembly protein SufD [Bacteroidales bacterium 36-12]